VGEHTLSLGGAKQRTVLALLLLRANEAVPVNRLVDELWGEQPPRSAAHTIEGYVSRLRRSIEPFGPAFVRRGNGYLLDPRGAAIDAQTAERLLSEATRAAAAGHYDLVSDLAREALRLWRGPALADVPLAAEAERLEEVRLRTLEQRFEADLALGRHSEAVSELQSLVDEHPYRERFVGQLMVALYRGGRQADALAVYERTRRVLDEELGLQPNPELQRLSGEIVRQEPRLAVPLSTLAPRPRAGPASRRPAVLALAALAAVTVIGAAAAALLVRGGGGGPFGASTPRVLLLLPRPPESGRDTFISLLVDGLRTAEREYGVRAETLVASETDVNDPSVAAAAARLRAGDADLVVLPLGLALNLAPDIREATDTRFVLLDASVAWKDYLGDLPNATGLLLAGQRSGYLVGYLSGLMEARRGPRLNDARVISVIGGVRGVPAVDELVNGFVRGARRALPGIRIRTGYAGDFTDQSKCETIANQHIDAGADIVFAAAGACSLGALRTAGIRGVWGVGVDADRSYLGPHILASAVKRYDQAVLLAVRAFHQKTLPAGRDLTLDLDDDAVGIAGISPEVPQSIRDAVARATAALRRGSEP
jgi:basic membrane lipoprotein Med (substrate-binding protein (PBP1-ABC) superfamily)/DNA-binding SARP family transcriptional activator